jgi:hypothetical protein
MVIPYSAEKFNKQKIRVKKYIQKNNCAGEFKDERRTFTKNQGEAIWDSATKHASFDPDVFRIDLLGCLVIKGMRYDLTEANRKFAYDLEHVVSYSANGITDVKNGALLNAGMNRSKKDVPFYDINYNEYVGIVYRFGIDPKNLLRDLEDDEKFTRQNYNLRFLKVDGIWTIPKKSLERLQREVYQDKNDDTNFFPRNIKGNLKIENQYELIVASIGLIVVHEVANKTIEFCLIGYNHVYYTAREHLGYEDLDQDTTLSYLQEIIKRAGAIIVTGAVAVAGAVLVAALKSQQRDSDNDSEE